MFSPHLLSQINLKGSNLNGSVPLIDRFEFLFSIYNELIRVRGGQILIPPSPFIALYYSLYNCYENVIFS